MTQFKLKITFENRPLMKAKAQKIDDFDNVFNELKKKFGGK